MSFKNDARQLITGPSTGSMMINKIGRYYYYHGVILKLAS